MENRNPKILQHSAAIFFQRFDHLTRRRSENIAYNVVFEHRI